MKKFLSMLALVALFTTSCSDSEEMDKPTPVTPPTIELDKSVVETPVEGGTFSVDYTVYNATDAAALPTATPENEDWVSNFVIDDSTIKFDVAASEIYDNRSVKVQVTYPGAEQSVFFTITQVGAEAPTFTISVKDVTATSFLVSVLPRDKESTYYCFVTEKMYLDDNSLDSDDELFDYSMSLVDDAIAESEGELTLANFAFIGDLTDKEQATMYDTEYVIYVYGIDLENRTRTTEVVRYNVTSAQPEKIDADFTIETAVDGRVLDVTVTPNGYDGYYYYLVWDTATITNYLMNGYDMFRLSYELWISMLRMASENGASYQEIIDSICDKGVASSYTFDQLEFSTDYMVLAFAIDAESYMVCSEPVVAQARTGEFVPAGISFDIEVSNLAPRSADLKITPTTDDPYTYFIYEDMTEQEVLDYIKLNEGYFGGTVSGPVEQHLTPLVPETNYLIIAFGYEAGKITSDFTIVNIVTPATPLAASTLELELGDYYDLLALHEVHPGNSWDVWATMGYGVVMPVKAIVSEGVTEYYYHLCPPEWIEFADGDLRRNIMYKGNRAPYLTVEYKQKYGDEVIPMGFAVDADGNFGKIWKGETIKFTEDGVSDPQGFLDWRESLNTMSVFSAEPEETVPESGRIVNRYMMNK